MAGFGSLIPQDWQQQEAEQNLRAIEEARIEKERAGKTWGQTASDVLTMPSRLVRSIAASTPEATDEQRAQWGSLATSPMLNKPAHVINTIGGSLVDVVKSGATLQGEGSQGQIPMWQDGHTNPEIIHRSFDTASLAGGASVAGNVGRDIPGRRLGRDVRILGRDVGSGEPFPHQLIDQPANLEAPMMTRPPTAPYQPRGAVDARVDAELGWHANDAGLTPVRSTLPRPWETGSDRGVTLDTLASDSGKSGAAIAAAEHAQPFFLTGEEALKNTARKSGTGEQWMNELKRYGAKPEELDWRGATEFLQKNSNTPITRVAVEEHLASNPFGLKRVDYNSMPENWKDLTSEQRYKVEEAYRDINGGPPSEMPDWYENVAAQSNKGGETGLDTALNPARWSQYKLPGGESYRERLQTLPTKVDERAISAAAKQNDTKIAELRRKMHGTSGTDEIRAEIRRLQDENAALAGQSKEARASTFKSDHFDDPNILYHRRTTDRTFYEHPTPEHQAALDARRSAEGEINGIVQQQHIVGRQIREAVKPLEYARRMSVQADIDAGRITTGAGWRKMMEDVVDHPELKPLQDKLQELRAQEDAVRKAMPPEPERRGSRSVHDEEQQSDMHQQGRKRGYNTPQVEADRQRGYQLTRKINEAVDQAPPGRPAERMQWAVDNVPEFGKWVAERNGIDDVAMKNVIPNAPFKESWPDLALKDLIREAAEKGADEISWTSGRSSPTNPKNLGMHGPEHDKTEAGLIQHYDKNQVSRANKIGKAHGVQVFEHNEPIPASESMSGEKALRILDHPPEHWDTVKHSEELRQKLFEDAYKTGHKIFRMKVPQSLKDQALKKGFSLFEDTGPAGATAAALGHATGPDWNAALKGGANVGSEAGLDVGRAVGGAAGGGERLAQAEAAAARHAGAVEPLAGLPRGPFSIGGEPYIPGPIASVHDIAKSYMENAGRPYQRQDRYHPIDEKRAGDVAKAFEEMPHAPDDPKVKASYDALTKETRDQYRALLDSGVKFEPIHPGTADPYAETPRLAAKDVQENKHLWFFPTEQGFGSNPSGIDMAKHPMMQPSGETLNGRPLLNNDLFRIVHDVFGHLKEGHGFRAAGEDNAWRTHAAMYSPEARPAMTTETRGQNSWLNYGPHGEKNRKASAADTIYAEQKVGVLPDWVWSDVQPKSGKPDWHAALKGEAYSPAGEAISAAHPGMKFAERYPETSPPTLEVNEKGREYFAKTTSPEAEELSKARLSMKPDIEAGNYTPYFDPAKRTDVDPAPYGEFHDTKTNLMKKPATREQYDLMASNPEAVGRLETAYANGLKQKDSAGNWYFMKQLEDEFIKELGPAEGRKMFKERFADAMAATTGGADPASNLLMAHYGNFLKAKGLPVPEAHQFPYPIGGQYAGANMEQFRKMIMEGAGIDPLKNEKRYNFSGNFLGRRGPSTIDEQMSNMFKPGMQKPPAGSYGHFERVIEALAAKYGVDPRYFQEVAWSGFKDMAEVSRGKKGYKAKPMISHVNDAIERTHRVTGMPRDEIVRRGLVRAEIPLYSDTSRAAFGSLVPAEDR